VPNGDSTPTPTPLRTVAYLSLYMTPNPATQRDTIYGYISSSYPFTTVVAHYIDYTEHQGAYVTDLSGSKAFTVILKSGTYDFWVTLSDGSMESTHTTLVVTP
jgi:hypothetical protein